MLCNFRILTFIFYDWTHINLFVRRYTGEELVHTWCMLTRSKWFSKKLETIFSFSVIDVFHSVLFAVILILQSIEHLWFEFFGQILNIFPIIFEFLSLKLFFPFLLLKSNSILFFPSIINFGSLIQFSYFSNKFVYLGVGLIVIFNCQFFLLFLVSLFILKSLPFFFEVKLL